jgi:predicted permease
LAAVVPLLLIACANVASLCLARAAARRSEVAVRTALGAGRGRIVRHMLTENVLVALFGGALGLLLAWGGVELLTAVLPAGFPRLHAVSMHGGVVLFLLGLTAVTALLAGLAPALQGSRCEPAAALHDGGGAGTERRTLRARGALVVAEVALAAALLVGGGLLLRSFQTLLHAGAGFAPEGVLTFSLSLPGSGYGEDRQRADFTAAYLDRLRALPGVSAVGAASDLPWTGWDENSGFEIVGDTVQRERSPQARYHTATPGYFAAAGWPLVAGRALTAADRGDAPPVLLVNESLARTYFAADDPAAALGRRLDLWGAEREIVGVVGDVADRPGDAHTPPAFYFPHAQRPFPNLSLVVRTAGEPLSLLPGVRRELAALDPELPVADVHTLDDVVAAAYAERRLLMLLTNLFAALAVLLFAVGAYGVLAYSVQQRRREMAIRRALGAPERSVVALVVGQGVRLAAAGLALGVALALLAGGAVSGFLYGVSPRDPMALSAAVLVTLLVAAGASLAPALRATRTDPAAVLRAE